jgi:hypothetical protein
MAGNAPDPRLEIVFAEALRALAHQQALLDNLRSRATLLTTAAALVVSLPGVAAAAGRTGSTGSTAAATAIAAAALTGVLLCSLVVCAPWWRWQFRSSATRLLDAVDAGHDADSIRRNLARDFESWLDRNDRQILVLQWWFTAGLVLLAVEVAAWVVQLAVSLR